MATLRKNAKQLVEQLAGKSLIAADIVDSVLGYRGLIVSVSSDDQLPEGVPASFRIDGSLPADYVATESEMAALSAEETDAIAERLLFAGRHAVEKEVLAVVEDIRLMRREGLEAEPAEPLEEEVEEEAVKLPCVISNTPYNPGFWNQPGVQPYNNCYNYAMNYRSDTFAQPGRISGHPNSIMQCANVAAAANWDGCTATCSGSNKNVALVIWPNVDYHWYRKHSEGFWGHKPGSTAARNTDNRGRLINGTTLTPQNCDRGPYIYFCGYRFSPTGMKVR